MTKVIYSYPDLSDAIRAEVGTRQLRKMSKRERLEFAASRGWVYDPPADYGANIEATHYVKDGQAVKKTQPQPQERKQVLVVQEQVMAGRSVTGRPEQPQRYATPTAARVLRDINYQKPTTVTYGKYRVRKEVSQEEYQQYKKAEREGRIKEYYEERRKPEPLKQEIVPTNVRYKTTPTSAVVVGGRKNVAEKREQIIKGYQEQLKKERGYAPTLAQARMVKKESLPQYTTTPKGKPIPFKGVDPVTGALVPRVAYVTEKKVEQKSKLTQKWEAANKFVADKFKSEKWFDTKPKYTEYAKKQKDYMAAQKFLRAEVKTIKEKPLLAPTWVVGGFAFTKGAKVLKVASKTRIVKPFVTAAQKKLHPKWLTTTKIYQRGVKFARRRGLGSKAMFGGFYGVPKTIQIASQPTQEQKFRRASEIPLELGSFYIGAKVGAKPIIKPIATKVRTKIKTYKFEKTLSRIESPKGEAWVGGKVETVYQPIAGAKVGNRYFVETIPTKRQPKGYDVGSYAPRERQLLISRDYGVEPTQKFFYKPTSNILIKSGERWVARPTRMKGQSSFLNNIFKDRETRLMLAHGVTKPMKVETRPFYQRSLIDYTTPKSKPIKQPKLLLTYQKPPVSSKWERGKKIFVQTLAMPVTGITGHAGGITITGGKRVYKRPKEWTEPKRIRDYAYSEPRVRITQKSQTRIMGGVVKPPIGIIDETRVYKKYPTPFLSFPKLKPTPAPPSVRVAPVSKQKTKTAAMTILQPRSVAATLTIQTTKPTIPTTPNVITPRSTTIKPNIVPRPKVPPPTIMKGFFLPSASYSISILPKRVKKKQPKDYTPSAFAAGFGIRGKPTKIGVLTGLGMRPIKKGRLFK